MVSVSMSEAEARKAGLIKTKTKTTRKAEPREKGTVMRCVRHDEQFETEAAENRHVAAHHGCRIEWVMS
jgi:hypothetical protein